MNLSLENGLKHTVLLSMSGDRNSYGNILKSIGLFGGVKFFQILIRIIRNKFVAVLLGPAGMGISGLITSTTNMINSMTGLGLHTSSVRDIAKATQSKDEEKIGTIVTVLRYIVIATGLLGMLITFLMAPILSQWAFGNEDFTISFRLVSVILFMDQLCVGQTALMQGTFHYKYMARASIFGSLIGLVITVPLYYIWNINAIVPVIIITSLLHLVLSWFYSNKIHYKKIQLSFKEVWKYGKGMITLGLAIALTGVIGNGKTYLLRTFISKYGNIADVGLFTAGMAIATQYVDIILQSMASDYSPRLAAISDNNKLFVETINRQLKLMVTIVTPLLIPFIVFIKQFTILLYSDKFLAIGGMIEWMMFGMFFRAVSWCYSYSIVAQGKSKLFFWNELLTAIISLVLFMVGYRMASFTGMGIAFCLVYLLYSIQMYIVCKYKFSYSISKDSLKIGIEMLFILSVALLSMKLLGDTWIRYIVGLVLTVIGLFISYRILNQMIPLKEKIQTFISVRKKKQKKQEFNEID